MSWSELKYQVHRRYEHALLWFVWHLPRKIAYWSYIRVGVNATTGKWSDTVVPELGMMDALQRWEDSA